MKVAVQDHLQVVSDRLAIHESSLRSFAATLAGMHEQVTAMIAEIEWDRARIEGLDTAANSDLETSPEIADAASAQVATETAIPVAEATAVAPSDASSNPSQIVACNCEVDETAASIETDVEPELVAAAVASLALALTAATTSEIVVANPVSEPAASDEAALTTDKYAISLECTAETSPTASFTEPVALEIAANAPSIEAASIVPGTDLIELSAALDSPQTVAIVPPTSPTETKIFDLDAHRRKRFRALCRTATAAASLMMLATVSLYYNTELQLEIGTHLSGLSACTMAAMANNQDCAALAWLSL